MAKTLVTIPYYILPDLTEHEEETYEDLGINMKMETSVMTIDLSYVVRMQPSIMMKNMQGTVIEFIDGDITTTPVSFEKMTKVWEESKVELFISFN